VFLAELFETFIHFFVGQNSWIYVYIILLFKTEGKMYTMCCWAELSESLYSYSVGITEGQAPLGRPAINYNYNTKFIN